MQKRCSANKQPAVSFGLRGSLNLFSAITVIGLLATNTATAGGYGHGAYYHGGAHYGYHNGGNEGAYLLSGLLIGGLIGYFISEDRHRYQARDYRTYGHPYPTPPVASTAASAPAASGGEFGAHPCLMTREYTTRIEVDGSMREAYGTKCLLPDQTWVLGRPKLPPEFSEVRTQ